MFWYYLLTLVFAELYEVSFNAPHWAGLLASGWLAEFGYYHWVTRAFTTPFLRTGYT
jgi:hypothetical protein